MPTYSSGIHRSFFVGVSSLFSLLVICGSAWVDSQGSIAPSAWLKSLNGITATAIATAGVKPAIASQLRAKAIGNAAMRGASPSTTEDAGASGATTAAPISATAAARLLDQTTFGPTDALIQKVEGEGVSAWLNEQFNTPATLLPLVPANYASLCPDSASCAESSWWRAALTGNDQLRQRVAFALSEMFVVSTTSVNGPAIPPYANILANDAFTNWSQIMKDVTLSPAMGLYLNMLNSHKPVGLNIADENFARENMQLFNLGINRLYQDGTLKLNSSGNPTPVYTEANVQAFARVFTGWTYANANGSKPPYFNGDANYSHPMVAVENEHDEGAKALLNGTTLAAGQTAEQDLADALDNIFQHPNLPPFVSKQLIQHLVSGNPSPAYVNRISAVFTDNGDGVRGDMKAVLTAILTDPEARAGDTDPTAPGGHLREPILWITDLLRGLSFTNTASNGYYANLSYVSKNLGEQPYESPSVFNFFPPDYVIPGTTITAPEFDLENTGSVTNRLTEADQLLGNYVTDFYIDMSKASYLGSIAGYAPNLVDALGLIFMHGQMDSEMRTAIIDEIHGIADPETRVRIAAYLVLTSSEYKILH
jgi:uncharacterized protein (DUF1800 family)